MVVKLRKGPAPDLPLPYRLGRRPVAANCCPTCGQKAELDGQIFLDMNAFECYRGGLVALLDRRETLVMHRLLQSWPRDVSYEDLVEHVWGRDPPVSAGGDYHKPYDLVHQLMHLLRAKLAPLKLTIPRKCRFSEGYRLEVEALVTSGPAFQIAS